MKLTDFLPVVVALNDEEKDAYTDILTSVGLLEPAIIDWTWLDSHREISWEEKRDLAKEVEEIVGDKPAVIMCEPHYGIAFCYNNIPIIIFDNDNDGYDNPDKQVFNHGARITEFGNGSFLLFRKGKKYILGTKVKSDSPNIKIYRPSEVYKILNTDIPNRFFMSLELDVYNSSITTAYNPRYRHDGWREKVGRFMGREGHLDSETVLDLSKKLVCGRTLVGINIAGYAPSLDSNNKTADLLKNYLREVLGTYIIAKK